MTPLDRSYPRNGTAAWAKDAEGREIRADNWKRGTAQEITQGYGTPEEVTVHQTIDDNGWVTDSIDGLNYTYTYSRDVMGRLTTYDPPGTYFTNAVIDYDFTDPITQTISKGDAETEITYDSLFRPTLVKTEATDTNWTSYVRTEYDAAGQVTFKSFPSATDTAPVGTSFTYDGLGRVLTEETSAGITTHSYLPNHVHRVTDPSGKWTDTYRQGYDGPGKGAVRAIYEGEGGSYLRRTYKTLDVHGKTHKVHQWGNLNNHTVSEYQHFYYDSRQRLCRYDTPEAGSTLYEYDASGYLTSYVKGQANGTGCAPIPTADPARVDLTYDGMGRLKRTDYVDWGVRDITRLYDDNSNLQYIYRGSTGDYIKWGFFYNELNQLNYENLDMDLVNDQYQTNYDSYYSYTPEGYVDQRKLPNQVWVDHELDGLGRDLKVTWNPLGPNTDLVDNVEYHPDGQVESLTYGNGHIYTKTLNALLQPEDVKTFKSGVATAFERSYTYDNRGQVTDIDDMFWSKIGKT